MNIPKTLKIGGHIYKIIFPYVFKERYDRVADCDRDACTIRIAEKECEVPRTDSYITVSLIHEVLHAIDNLTGQGIFKGTDGEKKIEGLSEGIYQVLVDNGYLNDKMIQTDKHHHKKGDIVSIAGMKDKFVIDIDEDGHVIFYKYDESK